MEDLTTGLKLIITVILKLESLHKEENLNELTRANICKLLHDKIKEHAKGKFLKTSETKLLEKFSAHTIESYLIEIQKGRYNFLEGNKKITNIICQYATGKPYKDFEKNTPNILKEDEDRCLKLLKLDSLIRTNTNTINNHTNFLPISYCYNLEYVEKNVEINVITYSLLWLDENLSDMIDKIKATNTVYRYLVTEDSDKKHLFRIRRALNEEDQALRDRIKIKTIFNSDAVKIEEIQGIRIPISNDIILYRQLKPENGKYEFLSGILSTAGSIKEEYYVLKIDAGRDRDIFRWFEEVWKRLPDEE